MQNGEIILTKNRVLEKMKSLLESVQQNQISYVQDYNLRNEIFKERIKQSQSLLGDHYISVNDDAWVHHLKESDYKKINRLTKDQYEQSCESFDHIKIAGRHSLEEWENMPAQLFENWKLLLAVCELIA